MIIDVFQDTVCPWCRIGKKHLSDAISKWDGEPVTIRYRTFFLDPFLPKEGKPFREHMEATKGGPQIVSQMIQHVTNAGKASGVHFNFDMVAFMPNTRVSHTLIKLAPDHLASDLVESIYRAYFEEGLDIGSIDVLVSIGTSHGLDPDRLRQQLESDTMQKEIEEDLELARQLEITGVPFFVIDNQLALSGAHPVETFLKAFRKVASD